MKIILLHGDDTTKSYERLQKFTEEAKKRNWKITDFSLSEIENQSLFDEESFYILRDYKLLDKKTLSKLEQYSGNLVVYHTGKISAPSIKIINPTKIELFELPQMLWKFLDNITIKGLHEITKTQPVEYIFAMIAWKFKQNFVKNPNQKNATLISRLAEIDVKAKTSNAKLIDLLDLLIAKQL